MGHFLLAEADAGVAQPQVLTVVLAGEIKIILPLHIEPPALPEQICVLQVVHVALHRIVGNCILSAPLLSGVQAVGNIGGIGKGADRGTQQIQDRGQHVRPLDPFALHDVFQIDLRNKRLQVLHLGGIIGSGEDEGHPAEEGEAVKGVVPVAAYRRVIFREAEGMHTDLVTSPPEFSQNIAGQHPGVAAGDVNIQVRERFQIVQRVIEGDPFAVFVVGIRNFIRHLDLIHKEIVLFPGIFHDLPDMFRQHKRVPEGNIPGQIKFKGEDVVLLDALIQQVALKDDTEQVGLPAPAYPGDHLHLAVPHIGNDSVEIAVTSDLHSGLLLKSCFVNHNTFQFGSYSNLPAKSREQEK